MQELPKRAREFAVAVHGKIDHRRKYTNEPYDVHLKDVARMVGEVTDDPEVLAAAWLHDTLEDTPATYEDIETEFGSLRPTHQNLNDGTLEGMVLEDTPAFSVQYHPEAAPGPSDANGLFDEFDALIEAGA